MVKKISFSMLMVILSFAVAPSRAYATLKTNLDSTHFSEQKADFESIFLQKMDNWRKKTTKNPIDPPDDDDPAERYPTENKREKRRNSYWSKWGFWLFLVGGILTAVGIIISATGSDSGISLILAGVPMTLSGILVLIYSFFSNGINWYNGIFLFALLLLGLALIL